MAGVEITVRQAREFGNIAKRRVESDIELIRGRSKTILEGWDLMKIMDYFWTARASPGEQQQSRIWKPYLIAVAWVFLLITFLLIYHVDTSSDASLALVAAVRLCQIVCVVLSMLCLLCCFEQGQNIILGGMFLFSVIWSAPPKKHATRRNTT